MENKGVLRKSIVSGQWMFFGALLQKIINFGSFFILARFLVPADFGIISIILLIPSFLDIVTSLNFETAVIYNQSDPYLFLNPIWTLNLIRGFVIFITIFFAGSYIAHFFHIESAATAVRLGGIIILIQYFANVAAQILFFKDIDFKKIFVRDIIGQLTYSAIAIPIAIVYKSFWALFFGTTAMYLSTAVATYILHSYKPTLSFNFSRLSGLLPYSKWLFGQNIAAESFSYAESAILGKTIGAKSLGLYNKAKGLAYAPSGVLISIINKVAFPAYSKIQKDLEKIKDGFIKSLEIIFAISIPFSVLLIASAQKLILILLGKNWLAMDKLLVIFALVALSRVFSIVSSNALNALGHPKTQLKLQVFYIILSLSLFLALTNIYGVLGAAFSVLITETITSSVYIYFVNRLINIGLADIFIKMAAAPLLLSFFILLVGKAFLYSFPAINNLIFLLLIFILALLYYSLIILAGKFFNIGPYKTFITILQEIKNG